MNDKTLEAKEAFRLLNFFERTTTIDSVLKKYESPYKKQYDKLINGKLTDSNLVKADALTLTIYDAYIDSLG